MTHLPSSSTTASAHPARSGPASWATTAPHQVSTTASKASSQTASTLKTPLQTHKESESSGDAHAPHVGGVAYFSTVDWPDHIASTVFLKGCPWRCSYCHNTHLLSTKPSPGDLAWDDVLEELDRRKDFLDAVVFSGGEPLSNTELANRALEVKALGYLVGLHTNGTDPARLHDLLSRATPQAHRLIDWVGLDIKAPFERYDEVTRVRGSARPVLDSLDVLQTAKRESAPLCANLTLQGMPDPDPVFNYELRTTLEPGIFDEQTLFRLAGELLELGEENWVWQKCRAAGSIKEKPLNFNPETTRKKLLKKETKPNFKTIAIR